MSEIRIQKIDGQEFVTLTDYLRLKEEKQELEYLGDINEELKEENKKLKERIKRLEFDVDAWHQLKLLLEGEIERLKSELEKFSESYKKYRDYEKEELAESCYDLERENQKLKERIAELEKCNLNLQEHIDRQNRGYEPQFENGFPKYKLLNHNK